MYIYEHICVTYIFGGHSLTMLMAIKQQHFLIQFFSAKVTGIHGHAYIFAYL